jgi:hypothetical protein
MSSICEFCGQKIGPGEAFILEGEYPTSSEIFSKTHFKNRTAPESYGKIYHAKCFEEKKKKD